MPKKPLKGDTRESRRIKRELSVYKSIEKKVLIFVLFYYYGVNRETILQLMKMHRNAYHALDRHIKTAPYEIAYNETAKFIFNNYVQVSKKD